jgi:hypothetical protein
MHDFTLGGPQYIAVSNPTTLTAIHCRGRSKNDLTLQLEYFHQTETEEPNPSLGWKVVVRDGSSGSLVTLVKIQQRLTHFLSSLRSLELSAKITGWSRTEPFTTVFLAPRATMREQVKSRDVLWLNKSYGKYHSEDAHNFDDDDFVETPALEAGRVTEAVAQDQDLNVNVKTTEDVEPTETEPLSTKQMREMRQLSGFFNPDAQRAVDSVDRMSTSSMRSGSTISTQENPAPTPTTTEIGDTVIDELFDAGNFGFNFAMFTGGADDFEEPSHYDNAWNNPDPAQQTKWRQAISKEFRDMETRKVWKIIKRSKIPEGRRCMKNRWVWKIKRDGTFRARLVVWI